MDRNLCAESGCAFGCCGNHKLSLTTKELSIYFPDAKQLSLREYKKHTGPEPVINKNLLGQVVLKQNGMCKYWNSLIPGCGLRSVGLSIKACDEFRLGSAKCRKRRREVLAQS